MPPRRFLTICLAAIVTATAFAKEYPVASPEEVSRVSSKLKPGDQVILRDGTWKDARVKFRGKGKADAPIIFRAQTPGKVVFTDKSLLVIDGEYVVLSGITVQNAGVEEEAGIELRGSHNRLTESAMLDCSYKFYVRVYGSENRVDFCYLAGKTSAEPTLQIESTETPNRHRIDHNHFGPREPLGHNGGETIRVGYSKQSMNRSLTLVEGNLFERCDGEIEVISNKSCNNIYRYNTFLDCGGMLTLRHGNGCVVEANFFLAHGKKGSGGIRVIGEGHVIVNNYIEGVVRGGIWITAGVVDSPLNGYFRAKDALIAFNTIVDSKGPAIDLDNGYDTSKQTLRPEGITIANNLFCLKAGRPLLGGTEGEGFKWLGNMACGGLEAKHAGIKIIDSPLQRSADGLWRPVKGSPVQGAAVAGFEKIRGDIDDQPRGDEMDVGCDQISKEEVHHRPLTAKDVGPEWRITPAK